VPSEHTRTVPIGGGNARLEYRGFTLTVVDGPDAGPPAAFETRAVEVGTDPGCDLVLTDRTASRRHCQLEVTEDGYRLTDSGSRNGTRLAGCRVGWAMLEPGTVFQVGTTKVRFDVGEGSHGVELSGAIQFGRMVGVSPAMRELFALLTKVARGDATVLLEAESGSGKELAAQAVHEASPRSEGPFEVFDCAAVPHNLVESELFGHEKGAFTGATGRQLGAFERAHGGTIFLDEIGELPQELQPKLLRVLESREFRRVGGNEPVRVDVRVLAATNRDLREMTEEGTFRTDLYHRLAVVRVGIPPLRRRLEDIPLLVEHFLDEQRDAGRHVPEVPKEAVQRLTTYAWPGNVRELRNFVERAILLEEDMAEMPFDGSPFEDEITEPGGLITFPEEGPMPSYHTAKTQLTDEWEKQYCQRILEQHGGNVSGAAREAGIHRKSLEYLLSKHGIKRR